MRAKLWILASIVLVLTSLDAYGSTVLTFEGLGSDVPVPTSYEGFTWTNFNSISENEFPGTGYANAAHSGTISIYNAYEADAKISRVAPFSVVEAWFTAAYRDGLNVEVTGFSGSVLQYTVLLSAYTTGPTKISFPSTPVDQLSFHSVQLSGSETIYPFAFHFAMDDFTFGEPPPPGEVPEPTSLLVWSLIGGASLGMGWWRRRRMA